MKAIRRFWRNIPRKVRVCINLLAILVLLAAFYILLGCPALTVEQHFRRLEKAYLLGPADIVETVELPEGEFDQMIVADDGDAVILYCCNLPSYRWDWGNFTYHKKSEGITVIAMPSSHLGIAAHSVDLPVMLFHDYPGAVRAELELTLGKEFGIQETLWKPGGPVTRQDFEKTYLLEAESNIHGYFRFTLHAGSGSQYLSETAEGQALKIFSGMFRDSQHHPKEYVPATVRLYDRNGELIIEEHLTIRSQAGQQLTGGES